MWGTRNALHQAVFAHEQLIREYLHAHDRLAADEGIASELLLSRVDGLHDVAFFVSDEFVVDGDGRVKIHRQLRRDRDQVRVFCSRNKFVFVQSQLHLLISMTTSRSLRPSTQPSTLSSA